MSLRRPPTLPARIAAAESTIARFAGQPFAWGQRDCLRLVAHALRELGHAPPLREAGEYRTLIGAHRALKRTGYASLDAWVDAWGLLRIPPAAALPGDVLALPSEITTIPALALALSNGRAFGFVPQVGGAAVFTLAAGVRPLAAWSV